MDDDFEDETTLTLKRGVTLDAVAAVAELPPHPDVGEDELMARCFVKDEGIFYVYVNGQWRPAPW